MSMQALDSFPIVFPIMFAVSWLIGVRIRQSREQAERLVRDAADAREEGRRIAAEAVTAERSHLARELHDAVGHAVNVMVMQAGAARLGSQDPATAGALRSIEEVGRAALLDLDLDLDLDRMLGLLRDSSDPDALLEPTHGLDDIPALVDTVRATGLDVEVHGLPETAAQTAGDHLVGATAYRVVQKSLTNAVKHAGPAHVDVQFTCGPGELIISVTDDGHGSLVPPPSSGGRGLAGMRERLALLGGTLSAGPPPGGGYAVHARLPRRQEPS